MIGGLKEPRGEVMRKYAEHVQPRCENDRNVASMTGARHSGDDSFTEPTLPHKGGTLSARGRKPLLPLAGCADDWHAPPLPSPSLVIDTLTDPGHCFCRLRALTDQCDRFKNPCRFVFTHFSLVRARMPVFAG